MTRLEDCCARCLHCAREVCMNARPESLRDCCGEVVCEECGDCECVDGAA